MRRKMRGESQERLEGRHREKEVNRVIRYLPGPQCLQAKKPRLDPPGDGLWGWTWSMEWRS
jgi:hypothetical protein